MNALAKAHRAYSAVSAPIRTARGTEFQAVARVTQRLKSAAQKGRSGFPELAAALTDNKKLWTLFSIDLSHPDNGLPEELRANLLGLAAFTHNHTKLVLARKAPVNPLIEINLAILRGLAGEAK